jgi:hypothetical protein
MNKLTLLVVLFCSACATEATVQSPDKVLQAPCDANVDNFDKAANVLASGARWTYNEAKGTYEWVFSEEHQKQAIDLLNAAKVKAEELTE